MLLACAGIGLIIDSNSSSAPGFLAIQPAPFFEFPARRRDPVKSSREVVGERLGHPRKMILRMTLEQLRISLVGRRRQAPGLIRQPLYRKMRLGSSRRWSLHLGELIYILLRGFLECSEIQHSHIER